VSEGKSRSSRLVCVGCCLVLACSGCIDPNLRQQDILRDDWPLELERVVSSAEDRTRGEEDRLELGPGFDAEPQPGPDSQAELPDQMAPEVPGLQEATCGSRCPPVSCDIPVTLEPGLLLDRIRCVWGDLGQPLRARIDARRYRHPRFHPVPLQPVFTPRCGEPPVADLGTVPGDSHVPAMPAGEGAPQIEIILPAPIYEGITPPKAEPEQRDRVTRLPRQLQTASRPGSWIFSPPMPRKSVPSIPPSQGRRRPGGDQAVGEDD